MKFMVQTLAAAGELQRELTYDGLPGAEAKGSKGGRRPAVPADKTDAVRTAYLEGRSIAALARDHGVSRGAIRTAVADLLPEYTAADPDAPAPEAPVALDMPGIELRLLTERRVDLVADRTRTINRLKGLLNSMFPALERVLDIGTSGALHLLTGYQTPAAIRRTGLRRLTTWLRNRKARSPEALATKAVEAAERQHTAVAGKGSITKMVHTLAKEVIALNEKIAETDKHIEGRFREHELAEVIQSVPGIGTILGAEFLVAVGGSLDAFPTPDRLAAFAGVTPAPRDSGKISGNLHRPQRYHRRLQRVFYTSALVSTPTRGSTTTANEPKASVTSKLCACARPASCQRALGPDP